MAKHLRLTVRLTALAACLSAAPAFGAMLPVTVNVGGQHNGIFGNSGLDKPDDDSLLLVQGPTLTSGQAVDITATGTVDSSEGNKDSVSSGPNGYTREDRPDNLFTPLEEQVVDAGNESSLPDDVPNNLALFGAFVDSSTAGAGDFTAEDEDTAGGTGVSSDSLFLVGDELLNYSAPSDGTLFFGVNESYASNNGGSFEVTVTAVPEPASLALLACGGLLMLGRRQRRA